MTSIRPNAVLLLSLTFLSGFGTAHAQSPASSVLKPNTGMRGTVESISKDTIVINSTLGTVKARLGPSVVFYKRIPSTLAQVNAKSFIGVTSVKQPDGSEKATEIHIFPDSLRGSGEGSSMMSQASGGPTPNRMTNGTVTQSKMTNGTVSGSRMTNGTVQKSGNGSNMVVQYSGKAQTVVVPPDVKVTLIAPTQDRPAVGEALFFVPEKRPDGSYTTAKITLIGPAK